MIIPFGLFIIVALFTNPPKRESLNYFYAKLLTPIKVTDQEDAQAIMELSSSAQKMDELKIFPNSEWEFRKLDSKDYKGFFWISLAIAGAFGLLIFLVSFGG